MHENTWKIRKRMIEVAKKHGITNAKGQMKNENDGSDMSGVWVGKKIRRRRRKISAA